MGEPVVNRVDTDTSPMGMETEVSISPIANVHETYDGAIALDPFSEVQHLRDCLSSSLTNSIRFRWRAVAGFALARHLRSKLLYLNRQNKSKNTMDRTPDEESNFDSFVSSRLCPPSDQTRTDTKSTEHTMDELKRQLIKQRAMTETIREAALAEIDRLRILLAAESGDHVAAVVEMEQRAQSIIQPLRQRLLALSEHYSILKQTYSNLEMQLIQLQTRETDNRLAVVQLKDRLVLMNDQKQMAFDRLKELESRMAWISSSSSPNPETSAVAPMQERHFALQNSMNKCAELQTALMRLEGRVTDAENGLDLMASRSKQAMVPLLFVDPLHMDSTAMYYNGSDGPRLASMDSSLSDVVASDHESRTSFNSNTEDVALSNGHTTAAEEVHPHANSQKSPITNGFVTGMNEPEIELTETELKPNKVPNTRPVVTGLIGPHAPRFCRFQATSTVDSLEAVSPVLVCQSVVRSPVRPGVELVTVNGPFALKSTPTHTGASSPTSLPFIRRKRYCKAKTVVPFDTHQQNSVIYRPAVTHELIPFNSLPHNGVPVDTRTNTIKTTMPHQARISKFGLAFKSIRRV